MASAAAVILGGSEGPGGAGGADPKHFLKADAGEPAAETAAVQSRYDVFEERR